MSEFAGCDRVFVPEIEAVYPLAQCLFQFFLCIAIAQALADCFSVGFLSIRSFVFYGNAVS